MDQSKSRTKVAIMYFYSFAHVFVSFVCLIYTILFVVINNFIICDIFAE